MTARVARDARVAQAAESEAQREASESLLRAQLQEARFIRLFDVRREVYAKFLDVVDEWIDVVRELSDTPLPKAQVRNLSDAEAASPVAARALRLMYTMNRRMADLELLADSRVRAAATGVDAAMHKAAADAAQGNRDLASVFAARSPLLTAMRDEYLHG